MRLDKKINLKIDDLCYILKLDIQQRFDLKDWFDENFIQLGQESFITREAIDHITEIDSYKKYQNKQVAYNLAETITKENLSVKNVQDTSLGERTVIELYVFRGDSLK